MRPTPIPAELVDADNLRRVFAAPNGDLTDDVIRPCEALVSRHEATGLAAASVRLVLEPGELEQLNAGGVIWLTMLGGLAPFDVKVKDA